MNETRRYFLACDRLDIAEHSRATAHRINCLRAIVEQLCDEARAVLHESRTVDDLFDALAIAFGGTPRRMN